MNMTMIRMCAFGSFIIMAVIGRVRYWPLKCAAIGIAVLSMQSAVSLCGAHRLLNEMALCARHNVDAEPQTKHSLEQKWCVHMLCI